MHQNPDPIHPKPLPEHYIRLQVKVPSPTPSHTPQNQHIRADTGNGHANEYQNLISFPQQVAFDQKAILQVNFNEPNHKD
jgi:hypothetical protein